MASRHPRIQVTRDPDLAEAIERGRRVVGRGAPAAQVVRTLALRGAEALDEDERAADRGRKFLHDVADGCSGLDLDRLRSVRDRAWQ